MNSDDIPKHYLVEIAGRRDICSAVISFILIFMTACSQGGNSTVINNANLPKLNDIITAPAPIQTAARSVVRIRTAGVSATANKNFLGVPSKPAHLSCN